ncbi:MAG: efflux RND transporter periplasmic adaptor subunit [Gemmatimonadetes bacterium]|nr:efflux RND transporter periplasmic adaptor subunit [Gemmatimonadota bacterium]
MISTTRLLVSATAVTLVATLAVGIYMRVRSSGGRDSRPLPDAPEASPVSAAREFATDVAIAVEGARVTRDTLVLSVTAAGQAEAWRRVTATAPMAGRVMSLAVRESDAVGEGGTLLRIDTAEYALGVARARSDHRSAEARFLELTLFDDEIEDRELQEQRARLARSRSGLDQAEVALREAELNLARTHVRAPFAGRVANLRVVEGQYVRAGEELATVVDLDPIKVEVQVLEGEIGHLAPGRRAAVSFAAFQGETFAGRIQTITPVVDPQTRTARVTVVLPNPAARIKPGMYAAVSLEARRLPDRILVPRVAILERDRRTMLFVYEGAGRQGRARWRYVTTGLENDSLVEIVPGEETEMLAPGEMVLVDGHYALVHDAVVRLVESAQRRGGRPR